MKTSPSSNIILSNQTSVKLKHEIIFIQFFENNRSYEKWYLEKSAHWKKGEFDNSRLCLWQYGQNDERWGDARWDSDECLFSISYR